MTTTYDYIVVGAGSAGCVLAARLSADPTIRVLLVEAGPPDHDTRIRIPAGLPTLFGSSFDWRYRTEPQQAACDRTVDWPSGRTLGGSSSTNAMIYVRGNPIDFDAWRDRDGCTGWGYRDLLLYFRRAEDAPPPSNHGYGQGGPLRVEEPRQRHRLSSAWIAAAEAHGLPANTDFNSGHQDGVGFYRLNLTRGRRWSAADGYLRPAAGRANLTILTDAMATRIDIAAGRATGVRYIRHGSEHRAAASREVLVSAGAVGSPHLLLLSGVGPPDQLRTHGIDVAAEAPQVGVGLQDHPRVTALWRAPGRMRLATARRLAASAQWWLTRRGPLASNGGEAGGFVRTREHASAPDLQYLVCPPPVLHPAGEHPSPPTVAVLVTAVEIGSRGQVWLRSPDPTVPPAIDPGYLTDPADLEILCAGVRQAQEIARHQPFADATLGELAPGDSLSDERLRHWIRRHVVTLHHPTSTCAMGGANTAVCDPQLRVRGVACLRVVDASVMPSIPRGNTHAPTVAIAERAADLILGRARTENIPSG